jgi:colanic acid/amylovoran biosynthesis glycosyltransferase
MAITPGAVATHHRGVSRMSYRGVEIKTSELSNQNKPVGHLINSYLTLTENWIYSQIHFQTTYPSIVLALQIKNQEQFPYDKVYALHSDLSGWRQWLDRKIYERLTGYYHYHYQMAREQQAQLLHAHFGKTGLHALPLAQRLAVPLLTSFYGADMYLRPKRRKGLDQQYRPLFEKGDLFLVEGPAARQRLEDLGCPPEKIQIQRLGVDLEKIVYCPRPATGSKPIRVLMAATFIEKKGMTYGVEAFCQAAREDKRLQLTVVGDAHPAKPEGLEIKKQLKALVSQYGMAGRADFLGYVSLDKLRRLAYEHHIFLHPSVTAATGDSEGGAPVVLTEMAASGLPLIATHHCDIPQVVLNHKTGILADERNIEQLRLALLQLAADDNLRLHMGRRGHEHAREHFSAKAQGQKLSEIYQAVLAGRSTIFGTPSLKNK